jgi:hypothetical protein
VSDLAPSHCIRYNSYREDFLTSGSGTHEFIEHTKGSNVVNLPSLISVSAINSLQVFWDQGLVLVTC